MAWNSATSEQQRKNVLSELATDAPDLQLLYTTPESLLKPALRDPLKVRGAGRSGAGRMRRRRRRVGVKPRGGCRCRGLHGARVGGRGRRISMQRQPTVRVAPMLHPLPAGGARERHPVCLRHRRERRREKGQGPPPDPAFPGLTSWAAPLKRACPFLSPCRRRTASASGATTSGGERAQRRARGQHPSGAPARVQPAAQP
jgi:hypothetical protein